jgi:hypothetical protein
MSGFIKDASHLQVTLFCPNEFTIALPENMLFASSMRAWANGDYPEWDSRLLLNWQASPLIIGP